jgi:hypothetical protein
VGREEGGGGGGCGEYSCCTAQHSTAQACLLRRCVFVPRLKFGWNPFRLPCCDGNINQIRTAQAGSQMGEEASLEGDISVAGDPAMMMGNIMIQGNLSGTGQFSTQKTLLLHLTLHVV